jgi:hypothetical protein
MCRIDPELYDLVSDYPGYFSWVFTGSEDLLEIEPDYEAMRRIERNHTVLPIGRNSLLNKDGSAKLRGIASPVWEVQCSLTPMQNILEYILRTDRCSAVHDQENGKAIISSWLASGRKCYGFDQSSFTDRFPYALQRSLLQRLSGHSMWSDHYLIDQVEIQLLDLAVKRPYVIPQLGWVQVTYAVGQPMGINPSFHLATLTHIMVCYNLARHLGLKGKLHNLIQVVGDDIVISDDRLANAYHQFMVDQCKVKINLEKSMISDRFTSFCGKILTAQGEIPAVKIRPIKTEASLAQKISFYGAKSIPFFSKEMRKFGKRVTMPYPFGYGVKPHDIPYKSWLNSHDLSGSSAKVIVHEISDFVESYSNLTPELMLQHYAWDQVMLELGSKLSANAAQKGVNQGIPRSPVCQQAHQRARKLHEQLRTPSFRDSVDAATRLTLSNRSKKKRSEKAVFSDMLQYTTELGYIDNRQNPVDHRGITLVKQQFDNLPGKSIDFSKKVIEETKTNLMEISHGKSECTTERGTSNYCSESDREGSSSAVPYPESGTKARNEGRRFFNVSENGSEEEVSGSQSGTTTESASESDLSGQALGSS